MLDIKRELTIVWLFLGPCCERQGPSYIRPSRDVRYPYSCVDWRSPQPGSVYLDLTTPPPL